MLTTTAGTSRFASADAISRASSTIRSSLELRFDRVRHPQGKAIQHDERVRRQFADRPRHLDRRLDRDPRSGPRLAVSPDPLRHLLVPSLCRDDHDDRQVRRRREPRRQRRLPAPSATQQHGEAHQYSIPRIAPMPSSNACFSLAISVTVSATARSAAGASRPVATMFTCGGRSRIVSDHLASVDPAPVHRVRDLVQHHEFVRSLPGSGLARPPTPHVRSPPSDPCRSSPR